MRVAALYDIHANLPALDAVLADVEREAPDRVLVGGDFAWGPWPSEVMDRLSELGDRAVLIRGNTEREILERAGGPWANANAWCADQLRHDQRELLRGLDHRVALDVDGLGPVLFCHGSPRADDETITTATSDARIREMVEGTSEPTIVCGHTHAQFDRAGAGRRVVNPGSVGLPFGRPGAYWAMFGPDVDLRRTTYDHRATSDAFLASGMPNVEDLALQVATPPRHELAAELFT